MDQLVNNNRLKFDCNNNNALDDCNVQLAHKTLKHNEDLNSKTILNCTKSPNLNNNKKLFVLIEANNDEECNRAINAIHSINPDANVNVFQSGSSTNLTTAASSDSLSQDNSFKNIRFLNSNSRSSFGSSIGSIDAATLTSTPSITNDGSIERQESRDSGFCSFSNSSFESMKSLSINDSNYGSQLTIPNDHNSYSEVRSPIRRKWKKEHAWRYTNSNTRGNVDENDLTSKGANINKIEPIDEKYEIGSSTEKSVSKDNLLEISLDKLNTNDSDTLTIKSNEGKTEVVVNQKKRGKLIREPTIDDENTMQASPTDDNDCNNKNDDNKVNSSPKIFSLLNNGRSSPPEKRATFNVQKQMSIDETYPILNDEKFNNCSEVMNDCERNLMRNRMREINHNHKMNSKYGKHDLNRNINTKYQFNEASNERKSERPKIPIVQVQSFIDYENKEDEEQQQDLNHEAAMSSLKENDKKNNINIIEHTNHSLDEALRTIKNHQQQDKLNGSFSILCSQTPAFTHLHGLKQNHSFDCDYKPTNFFEPKISLSSASLINHTNSMQTPPIQFTQSASLDRYNYHPLDSFNLSKSPYSKKVNTNETSNCTNKGMNNKLFPSFDQQHHYSEPMIKMDQNEPKLNSGPISTSASSSPSLSPSMNASLFLTRTDNALFYNQLDNSYQQKQNFHPLYQLHQQNSLSASSPAIKESLQHKQESYSQSPSPKINKNNSNSSQQVGINQNEILNAIFQPYLQNMNQKKLQTQGYPFQSYLQNKEIIYNLTNNNLKQLTIPQLGSLNIKNENDLFQQQKIKLKAEYDKSNQYFKT